ncbi:male-specific lethal 3 [Paragonimus westermani]|uniref:Male-specific lethal 3 n=1 Tax=Paragonimus westermani TaxID=34504 RepID=A0A5J4NI56_9TREM|nr:male-specific lethal 3 [Paragonimus westermani]
MAIHRFEVGQKLLCFEPDSSKAKVIYLAKVLKHVNKKSDVPYYAVHFQGWKCKWDREVPEHLLLENTEFNRMLKRRIDDIAHNVRCRLKRKQRIDQVLELAAVSGESVNWDQIPGSRRQDPGRIRTCSQKTATTTSLNSSSPTKVDTERSEEFEAISLDEEDPVQSQYENLQVHRLFTAPVELPGKLRSVLNSHGPGTASSGTVSCSERAARVLGPAYLRTDQNRILCADVCSSLRILFDTTLQSGLHPVEQQTSARL